MSNINVVFWVVFGSARAFVYCSRVGGSARAFVYCSRDVAFLVKNYIIFDFRKKVGYIGKG